MNLNLLPVTDFDTDDLSIYKHMRDNVSNAQNSFIADSPKVVLMLLESDLTVHSLLATQSFYEEHQALIATKAIPKLFVADRSVMETISGHKVHHNVMMHGLRPEPIALEDLQSNAIMLDHIASTENVGSIARSAAALGVKNFLVNQKAPHPFGRRSLRVSMGHVSMLDYHIFENTLKTVLRLQALGYTVCAAEVTPDAIKLQDMVVPSKWVLLMGHEGKGLAPEVIQACDLCIQIDMAPTIKSFNVSVAASILMHWFVQNS